MRSVTLACWTSAVAAILATAAVAAPPAPQITSQYVRADHCREAARGADGQDWFYERCDGARGVPVWRGLVDSTRLRLGFGRRPNFSGMYDPQSLSNAPIEWRGVRRGGRTTPFAAIVRVSDPGEGTRSHLVVFRLRADGTSCVIGRAEGLEGNVRARAIADGAVGGYTCEAEPDVP
jgi:hypothetical protein